MPQPDPILSPGTEATSAILARTSFQVSPSPGTAERGDHVIVAVTPTQVRRPWRATARTVFQAAIGLAVLFPLLVQTAGLDPESAPWLVVPLAVAGAFARIMALPQVNTFLARFLPFLSAAGR